MGTDANLNKPKRDKKRGGFTLLEVIVVIAILGILTAMALPNFSGMQQDAQREVLIMNARKTVEFVNLYLSITDFVATNADAVCGGGEPAHFRYVLSCMITPGFNTTGILPPVLPDDPNYDLVSCQFDILFETGNGRFRYLVKPKDYIKLVPDPCSFTVRQLTPSEYPTR